MSNKILVYIDQFKGEALPTSWEVLGAAQVLATKLDSEVIALTLGQESQPVASQAFKYGAKEVFYCDDQTLADYRAEPFTALVAKLAQDQNASVLLFPTTSRGRELAAMCSIDLEGGVMPDVTALDVEDGKIIATRPVYAGKILCKTYCESGPQIITTRVRAFKKPVEDASLSGSPVRIDPVMTETEIHSKISGYSQAEVGVSLSDASVIVSGGRGVSNNPALTSSCWSR